MIKAGVFSLGCLGKGGGGVEDSPVVQGRKVEHRVFL